MSSVWRSEIEWTNGEGLRRMDTLKLLFYFKVKEQQLRYVSDDLRIRVCVRSTRACMCPCACV